MLQDRVEHCDGAWLWQLVVTPTSTVYPVPYWYQALVPERRACGTMFALYLDWNFQLSHIQFFTGNRHTPKQPCTEAELAHYIQVWRTRAKRAEKESNHANG